MRYLKKLLSSRRLTAGLFLVYFLVLVWLVMFKGLLDLSLLSGGPRSLNLLPFAQPRVLNGRADWSEVWLNLLLFLPFGLYMGLLAPNRPPMRRAAPFFLVSLAFELLQFCFGAGAADITDIISNTCGGLLGLGLCALLRRLLKERAQTALNLAALVCTVPLLSLLALLAAANL